MPTRLGGPEQVFRFTLRRQVANFGVVVVQPRAGNRVSPRLVAGNDENRVVGYTGFPASLNPYQGFDRAEPVVGAVLPDPGTYEFVFDTPTGAKPGAFTFRFWVNDTSPPSIRLLDHKDTIGRPIRVAVRDSGSGVDPRSLHARSAGSRCALTYADGVLLLRTKGLRAGQAGRDRQGVGLPGDEEHGGRRPGAPEHARPPRDGDAPPLDLAGSGRP